MFLVIPAVDVKQGRAVRLTAGDPRHATVYFEDPVAAAGHFAAKGATWLHLVDLDAALASGDNREVIALIAKTVDARCEVGGGIRSAADARRWLEVVDRVVLGTLAVAQPLEVASLLDEFGGERVAVSIDARHGQVAVKGWTQTAAITATDMARQMADLGVTQLIYTDVTRDGTLQGVDPAPVAAIRAAFAGTLVAGGGVAGDADLALYEALGLQGAIVGKALYEGKITYPRVA